jgi:integrase
VYKTVIAKLSEYSPNLDFVDITREFLLNYKKWLEETKLNKQNTVHKNLTTIRTVYYEAVNSEKFEPKRNPFLSLKLKKERSNRVKLSEDELDILFKAELEVDSLLFHARNIFLFQYYAFGMRIADALQLKWLNIKDNRVDYIAQKTKKRHDVRLPKEALMILDYYKALDKKPHSYVFPFLDNKLLKQATDDDKYRRLIESKTSQVNTNLKKLSVRVGINKNISTHVSRHSFAENARKKTGDIYAISKALGHSNISITEAYFAQEARNDTDRLSDLLFGE